MTPIARLKAWERDLRRQGPGAMSGPGARARARAYEFWLDHGFLRRVWTNFFEVSSGVYRSNQPDARRLARWRAMGITTVLNLRGALGSAPMRLEQEACAAHGITMHQLSLTARQAPEREAVEALIALFRRLPRPFVMHCKSGADRAGFASAVYRLAIDGAPLPAARAMLSPRFVHLRWTKTGILDHILDSYETSQRATGVGFEDWIRREYDPEALQRSFDSGRGRA